MTTPAAADVGRKLSSGGDLQRIDVCRRTAYLSVSQIDVLDSPLLREPLGPGQEQVRS